MKVSNTLTAIAVLSVAGGLFGGVALVTGGGGVAAQAAAEGPTTGQPPKSAGPAAKAPPGPNESQREADLRRLRELREVAEGLQKEVDRLQVQLDALRLESGLGDPDARRRLAELAGRTRELDRELLVEEVRDLAKADREARRRLVEAEQRTAGRDDGGPRDRSLAAQKALATQASKDFQLARANLQQLDAELIDRHEREARVAQAVRNDLHRLTRSLELKRGLVARLDAEQIRIELRILGVEQSGLGSEGVSELLREVRELRREVQDLKQK